MWGFWREAGYITTYKTLPLPLWYFITLMFPALMLIGFYTKKKAEEQKKANFFYTLWWIGLIFATGISHPITRPIFDFFFNYIPFFSGFRDSHKFVVFICLAYAYLCPIGIMWITNKIKSLIKKVQLKKVAQYGIPILFAGLIILYTYPLIGLWGQIKPVEYPGSYQETNEYLKSQNLTGHILYLPWEGYLTYSWTLGSSSDGRIATPINKVVEPIIVASPGQWGGKSDFQNNISLCLSKNSIECLENQSIQFILKDKCALYVTNYPWINKNLVHEDNCIQIYMIKNKLDIDRTIKPPLRFIIGSLLSLITLIGMIIYLILHSDWYKRCKKKK